MKPAVKYEIPDADKGFKQRLGRCYELAGRFVLHNSGTRLVHGTIQGYDNPRIKHAWALTPDGTVYEAVANKFYDQEFYDFYFNSIAERVYDHHQTIRKVCIEKVWTAWHELDEKIVARLSGCANVSRGRKTQGRKDRGGRDKQSDRVLADRRPSLPGSDKRADRHLRVSNGAALGVRADSLETLQSNL